MGSSCGPCSITGVLKYYGVRGTHYDLKLIAVEEYERQTGKAVKGEGTNVQGFEATVERLGFDADSSSTPAGQTPPYPTYEEYMAFIRSNLEAGIPVVVSHNLGSGHYLTVIGLDDMGTDYIIECIITDANDTLGNGNTRQLSAVIKGAAGNHFCILVDLAEIDICGRRSHQHRIGIGAVAQIVYIVICVVRQLIAGTECSIANFGDTVRNTDISQAAAPVKRTGVDRSHAGRDMRCSQAVFLMEPPLFSRISRSHPHGYCA